MLGGTPADGALVFLGTGRGIRMFGVADHDAELLAGAADPAPVPGAGRPPPRQRGRHVQPRADRAGRNPFLRPSSRGRRGPAERSSARTPFARVTLSRPASKGP